MSITVAKFGGTSVADAEQIRKVAQIVRSDPDRKYIVVSAPGKRSADDMKVTDLLYRLYEEAVHGESYKETLKIIENRFREIIRDLGITFDIASEFYRIRRNLEKDPQKDYLASRGEYLNAKIIAAYLKWPFVDTMSTIRFEFDGKFDGVTSYRKTNLILSRLEHAVLPGFYGAMDDGTTVTFSRGGSDITGAIVARSVHADLYENWTDVSGMLTADPRIIDHPKAIDWISYRELRELSYMGASVLHDEAVFPVRNAGIPIVIRNTNSPDEAGTQILSGKRNAPRRRAITGIAGKKNLSNLQLEKGMMNAEVGFGARVLEVLAKYGVAYEHMPTSIDTMSVIVETNQLDPVRNEVMNGISRAVKPDRMFIEDGIAVIAVVGEGLAGSRGIAAKLFSVISEAGINIRMIDVGFSEVNIIVGVNNEDYEKTIHAVYEGLKEYF